MNNVENYSFQDIANVLSKISNKNIAYTSPTAEVYADALTKAGVPREYIGMFAGFAAAIQQGEFNSEKTDLENILGRKPATLEDFLTQLYAPKN